MSTQKILLEERDDVATLTLNRPDRGNLVDGEMMEAVEGILSELSAKGRSRVLVVCGQGDHFCAGREPWPKPTKSAEDWGGELGQIVRVNRLLTSFPGITIALVQGKANGFGFGLAVLSDLTLAAENSRFSFSEIKAGFPPTIVMSYLSRWMSRKKAFEMVITGEEIDGQEAERLGLVTRVVTQNRLVSEGERWVNLLLKQDAKALAACKEFFRETAYLNPEDAARYGVALLANFTSSKSGR